MNIASIKTRILLVDDHQIVRQGIALLLNLQSDMQVVGEADSGPEAIVEARVCQPQVVVMDLNMPKGGGLPAIQSLKADNPHVRVIVLTSFSSIDQVDAVREAGAEGFLIKESSGDYLVEAIRALMNNHTYLDPELRERKDVHLKPNEPEDVVEQLTSRERQIIQLIAQGCNNQRIADQLFISLKTVKTHVTHILDKLQLEDRTQAAVYAIRQGWA